MLLFISLPNDSVSNAYYMVSGKNNKDANGYGRDLFWGIFQHFPGGTEENYKNFSKGTQYPSQDYKKVAP